MNLLDCFRALSRRLLGKARPPTIALLAVWGLLSNGGLAQAYDKDTHFALTYYLAIKVGYRPDQALQIASANYMVDVSANTQPLPPLNPFVRADYHAFASSSDPVKAAKEIEDRKAELWDDAVAKRNPGMFLHFLQDKYSHEGFGPTQGHLFDFHFPDYISNDTRRAKDMARATVGALSRFMKEVLNGTPLTVTPGEIDRVIGLLSDANPWWAGFSGPPDYLLAAGALGIELGFPLPAPDLRLVDDGSSGRVVFDDNAPKGSNYQIGTIGFDSSANKKQLGGAMAPSVTMADPVNKAQPSGLKTPTPGNQILNLPQLPSYKSPPSGVNAPIVPFPTPVTPNYKSQPSGMKQPSVPMPTPVAPTIGTASIKPSTSPQGKGPDTYRVVFDDNAKKGSNMPAQVTAPKGVAMRVGIDRGTLQRASAPTDLLADIRGNKE